MWHHCCIFFWKYSVAMLLHCDGRFPLPEGVFAVTVHTMSFLVCMISTLWSMRFCISMSMFRRCVADSGNLDLIFARVIK